MYQFPPIPVLISERAKETPDDILIESISTSERISWKQLDQNSRTWADALRRLGVEPYEYVVTLMPNTPDATYAWLGCAWLRAREVPVNTGYRGEWLTHAINLPPARVIITSRRFEEQLRLIADMLDRVRVVVVYDAEPDEKHGLSEFFRVVNGQEFFADAHPADGLPEPQIWDIMSVIYTSGTTGEAKAVLLPWGVQEALSLLYSPPEFHNAVIYGFWPSFHSLGKNLLLLAAGFGGKLVTREQFSLTDFWDDVRKYDCTAAYVVSVIASFLMAQPERDDDADNPLKAVLMGPVISKVDDFKRRFGVNVYTAFGSTEVGAALYGHPREITSDNWRSCGRILPEAPLEVAVVDEHDLPVAPGVPGELVVRPAKPWTMSVGYLNMPEANERAWRNGWFHTGDAFVYDEQGDHYFLDRSKDYIRRRGENISSFEIERAVCSFPGAAQAAAVSVPSDVGEDEVMVFVLPEEGQTLDMEELGKFLVERMPKFAVPRFIEVVESFPTTQATFRIQKHKLRERGPGPQTFDRLAATSP
jgi:crotonobetaine/carnitine-CoA ligase